VFGGIIFHNLCSQKSIPIPARFQSSLDDCRDHRSQHTKLLPHTSKPPIGANKMPMMNNVGRTVLGVSIGCQALSRCCLNAVSNGRM
jgi:hypothetical protein